MNLRILVKFWRVPLGEKAALILAIATIGLIAAALRILPFRWISHFLGEQIGAVGCIPVIDEREEARAQKIKLAIGRAIAIAPFRSDCLPQAVAAVIMGRLLAVPIAIHVGVCLGVDQQIHAHAWTAAGRIAVTGGDCFDKYSIVSCQISPAPRWLASVFQVIGPKLSPNSNLQNSGGGSAG